jgi:hypothetical protein
VPRNRAGGGANTQSGRKFEELCDLRHVFSRVPGCLIKGHDILLHGKKVGGLYSQYNFYDQFLAPKGIDWKKLIARRLLPDQVVHVLSTGTVFVIEVKTQSGGGSVDEKLQTFQFKRRQYEKLLQTLDCKLELVYRLDHFFSHTKYRDTLNYMHEFGIHYFFEEIPFDFFKLGG